MTVLKDSILNSKEDSLETITKNIPESSSISQIIQDILDLHMERINSKLNELEILK